MWKLNSVSTKLYFVKDCVTIGARSLHRNMHIFVLPLLSDNRLLAHNQRAYVVLSKLSLKINSLDSRRLEQAGRKVRSILSLMRDMGLDFGIRYALWRGSENSLAAFN